MKKRIGWLNNKPIIQGDKNLKNSNELHIDELSSSNSQGGETNTSIKQYFYRYDKDKIMELLGIEGDGEGGIYTVLGLLGIIYNISNIGGGTGELVLSHYTYDKHLLPYCRLIDFNGSPSRSLGTDDSGIPQVIPLNGDVFKRIEFIYNIFGQPDMIPLLQSCFIEITEEEYLSKVSLQLPINS